MKPYIKTLETVTDNLVDRYYNERYFDRVEDYDRLDDAKRYAANILIEILEKLVDRHIKENQDFEDNF